MAGSEVIAMIVSGIAVTIIIFLAPPYFTFIDPQTSLKIRVSHVEAFIKDSHDNRRVSGTKFPCLFHIYIGSGNEFRLAEVSIVDHMPLKTEMRVIEFWISRRGTHLPHRLTCKRDGLLSRSPLQGAVILNSAYLSKLCQIGSDLLHWMLFRESYDIPKMESLFTDFLFRACVYREYPLDLIAVHKVENFVHAEDSGALRRSRRTGLGNSRLIQDIAYATVEAYKELSFQCLLRNRRHLFRHIGASRCHILNRTGCKACREGYRYD